MRRLFKRCYFKSLVDISPEYKEFFSQVNIREPFHSSYSFLESFEKFVELEQRERAKDYDTRAFLTSHRFLWHTGLGNKSITELQKKSKSDTLIFLNLSDEREQFYSLMYLLRYNNFISIRASRLWNQKFKALNRFSGHFKSSVKAFLYYMSEAQVYLQNVTLRQEDKVE